MSALKIIVHVMNGTVIRYTFDFWDGRNAILKFLFIRIKYKKNN